MEIILAKTAGFCFGVGNAVKIAENLINNYEGDIYTLGPIIHNRQVVERLEQKGVKVLESPQEVEGPGKVIIRTHGVVPEIYGELEKRGVDVIDATCPYVKKIHQLVSEKYNEGYQIIIVGDRNHPEVIGINGRCANSAIILDSVEQVDSLPDIQKEICVVAQTTINREKWDAINNSLQKRFKNLTKFDTICNATTTRQREAVKIASNVDLMLVIGSRKSSNTQKLFEICKKYCNNTYQIETAGEIPPVDFKKIKKTGITAGASTPDWVIEEVILKMEELSKQALEQQDLNGENKQEPEGNTQQNMRPESAQEPELNQGTNGQQAYEQELSFAEAFEKSMVVLEPGSIVKGRIIGYNSNEVFVDLGYKSDGIITMEEFSDDPEFVPGNSVKIGDEIEVYILKVNDGEGNVLLSKKRVDAIKNWEAVEKAYEENRPIDAKVVSIVKGGVMASAGGIRIFIPASQISDRYEKDLSTFLKKNVTVKIIEFNRNRKKLVGSRKVVLEEQKKVAEENFWNNIELGKAYKGEVKSLTNFGAFVDLGGVDGLIHISELSWTKIKHPSEVLKQGDVVEVYIKDFDKEQKRVSLGYRKQEDNPWYKAAQKYNVGDIVKGRVARLVPFGAFVELEEGVDGLVHISQISNVRIAKPSDVLEVGQTVEAKIMEMDTEAKKISLSIKEVSPIDPPRADEPADTSQGEEELPTEHREEMTNTIAEIIETSTEE